MPNSWLGDGIGGREMQEFSGLPRWVEIGIIGSLLLRGGLLARFYTGRESRLGVRATFSGSVSWLKVDSVKEAFSHLTPRISERPGASIGCMDLEAWNLGE